MANAAERAGISGAQMKALWATARQLNMDSDDLHARIHTVTGKSSVRELTQREAYAVLDGLKRHDAMTRPMDRASQAQINVILGLARKLGWLTDGKERLVAFVSKRFGVDNLDWMTPAIASNVTEALKAMLAGGRGERKG